ncbi:5-formyltetrahydrofolate cyclo-ligase [Sphingomonas sp. KC8]|uniref:5-formyltetrahydrofolate cyclo-ligase n=1 Tax=Sphingomonas sp. KC8 TaxID=1030157 RepID=UPI0002488B59|nr:5-formyltetrahydrofolate cyclo-ligase [Sphingomonas sp. KC8]
MSLSKPDVRRTLRLRRRAFVTALKDAGQFEASITAITTRISAHLGDCATIAAYWPIGAEVDPRPALLAAHAAGRSLALPRVTTPDAPMTFHRWRPGDSLVSGGHGLLQPPADSERIIPDLILTPLLGFDRRLMRLGQGAGYYDRLFARAPHIRRIGLAWSAQEVEEAPADAWDIPLHGLATELEWIEPETK